MNPYFLKPDSSITADQVGMRAFHLNDLLRRGYRLPASGFLSTGAYHSFAKAIQLHLLTDQLSDKLDPQTLSASLSEVRGAIMAGKIPDEIHRSYRRFTADMQFQQMDRLVVVSSGNTALRRPSSVSAAEEVIRDIACKPQELFDAVKRIWALQWCERNIAYQIARDIPFGSQPPGIIIQRMLVPQLGGMLRTQHGAEAVNRVVVEYSTNSPEPWSPVASYPESLIFDRQARELVKMKGGPLRTQNHKLFMELIDLALRLESELGYAIEVDWAIENGAVSLLQVLPTGITPNEEAPNIYWSRKFISDVLPDVMTPASWSLLKPIINQAFQYIHRASGFIAEQPGGLVVRYQGKAYFNETVFNSTIAHFYPGAHFRSLGDIRISSIAQTGELLSASRNLLLTGARILRLTLRASARISGCLNRFPAKYKRLVWKPQLSVDRCLHQLMCLNRLESQLMSQHLTCIVFGEIFASLLAKICEKWFPDRHNISVKSLMKGLDSSSHNRFGAESRKLAEGLRDLPEVRQAFLAHHSAAEIQAALASASGGAVAREKIDEFLHRFGHCCRHEFELFYPRWQEDPAPVYQSIRELLAPDVWEDLTSVESELAISRNARKHQALASLSGLRQLPVRFVFRHALSRSMFFLSHRHKIKQGMTRTHSEIKQYLLSIGEWMVERQQLKTREDILFLDIDEINEVVKEKAAVTDQSQKVLIRRKDRERFEQLVHPRRLRQVGQQLLPESNGHAVDAESLPESFVAEWDFVERQYHSGLEEPPVDSKGAQKRHRS